MTKVVLEHYPVEKLPEDLQLKIGVPASAKVKVTLEVETEIDDAAREALRQDILSLIGKPAGPSANSIEGIRAMRDEWD
jgi:hypothetical protein